MTSIEYYKTYFPTDLQNIKAVGTGNVLSIYSLTSTDAHGHFAESRRAFLNTKSPYMFLLCFFYTVLIDQAIHSNLRHEYDNFEKIAGYPKFVGILSSFNSNMDPSLLLLIATTHIKDDPYKIKNDFKELTEYFLEDYRDFLQNIFPEYSLTLQSKPAQDNAIRLIFQDIQYAMKWEMVSKHSNFISPDLNIYESMIKEFNRQIEKKILQI